MKGVESGYFAPRLQERSGEMTKKRQPRHAPATLRNREPILAVLLEALPESGLVLEIASGTGEHAAWLTPRLPEGIVWQPSDADSRALDDIDAHAAAAGCARIRPALLLDTTGDDWPVTGADAVFCANMLHIAPWAAARGVFSGSQFLLPRGAPLIVYGPFKRDGRHTAPSNALFDESLRARDERWGVRCLDTEVAPLARAHGFRLDAVAEMPANNLTAIFRRDGEDQPRGAGVGV